MQAHGHTTVWGTQIGVGRTSTSKGWYQQIKAWWAARNAMRREAKLAALAARWDAGREAVRVLHADAALDLVAPLHVLSTATALYDLSV